MTEDILAVGTTRRKGLHSGHRPRRPRERKVVSFSEPLSSRLAAYAVAAGAAGVGMLASAPAAKAEIIFTPTNFIISTPFNVGHSFTVFNFDVDGLGALRFSEYFYDQFTRGVGAFIVNLGVSGPAIVESKGYVGALRAGAPIGPKAQFGTGGDMAGYGLVESRGTFTLGGQTCRYGCTLRGSSGAWKNVDSGYLGVKFNVSGLPHFGWVSIEMSRPPFITATITGYAYNTVPNQQILAGQTVVPEPATLGLLALGWLGLGLWRRKKQESEVRSQESE